MKGTKSDDQPFTVESIGFLDGDGSSQENISAKIALIEHMFNNVDRCSDGILHKILDFVQGAFDTNCASIDIKSKSNIVDDCLLYWNLMATMSTNQKLCKRLDGWPNLHILLQYFHKIVLNRNCFTRESKENEMISSIITNMSIIKPLAERIVVVCPTWVTLLVQNASTRMEVGYLDLHPSLRILQNLAQSSSGREMIWTALKKECPSSPFHLFYTALHIKSPEEIRLTFAGLLKNMTFLMDNHRDFVDNGIISPLLLPLAGNDCFTIEENDTFEPVLQYLEDKERDPNLEVRKCLLQAILRLCNSKDIRETFRSKNVYLILREYHKSETNEELQDILEYAVNLLLRTEEEIGVENLNLINDDSETTPSS